MKQMKMPILILSVFLFSSCSTMIKNVTGDLVDGVMQQKDMLLIEDGAPAYLLIVESLIYNNPKNRDYLMAGIQMFSSYSGAFVKDPIRQTIFKDKISAWGEALLNSFPLYKEYAGIPATEKEAKDKAYAKFISSMKKKDIPYVFWGFYGQISNILGGGLSDPGVFMILPRVVALAEKIYQLDDHFMGGMPHLFFGVYNCAYPEAFGGSFEKGKKEFDLAFQISAGKILLYRVLYAEFYYKPQYDRENYVKTLQEVISFDLESAPESRVMNIMAQEQAKKLLEQVDEFFY